MMIYQRDNELCLENPWNREFNFTFIADIGEGEEEILNDVRHITEVKYV